MRVLVTGPNGFVGRAIIERLKHEPETSIVAALRKNKPCYLNGINSVLIGDINEQTDFSEALSNVDVVIHTAAKVHVVKNSKKSTFTGFSDVNVGGTLNLAKQAISTNVKRFIYISSIKVNGESTTKKKIFCADDTPTPISQYAISKAEAEAGLIKIERTSELEVVIIRPTLVYGPGVKANFLSMMRWVHRGIPLPLGAIHNKRSFVAIENLVDLIVNCIHHPKAANQIFLVSDDDDLSTTELFYRLSNAFGKKPRLVPVPHKLLEMLLKYAGKESIAQKLCDSMIVDISKTKAMLGWNPIISSYDGIKKSVEWYLRNK